MSMMGSRVEEMRAARLSREEMIARTEQQRQDEQETLAVLHDTVLLLEGTLRQVEAEARQLKLEREERMDKMNSQMTAIYERARDLEMEKCASISALEGVEEQMATIMEEMQAKMTAKSNENERLRRDLLVLQERVAGTEVTTSSSQASQVVGRDRPTESEEEKVMTSMESLSVHLCRTLKDACFNLREYRDQQERIASQVEDYQLLLQESEENLQSLREMLAEADAQNAALEDKLLQALTWREETDEETAELKLSLRHKQEELNAVYAQLQGMNFQLSDAQQRMVKSDYVCEQ
eukprot:753076-Hanusia_phi.AAC.1